MPRAGYRGPVTTVRCTVLGEAQWRARRRAHAHRVRQWTEPHRERQSRGESEPVQDFLFVYYNYRPAKLERWHPGAGVILENGAEFLDQPGYREVDGGVALDPAALTEPRRRICASALALLSAVARRRPKLNCFGLHEWAMVYREPQDGIRHADWPLRLGHAGTDAVLESQQIRCGHYDAFRFFTDEARPRNTLQPASDTRIRYEQPGCLHHSMDLYKVAFRLAPFVPAELVADCFDLAVRIRELDMRASPYDLTALGYHPVPIETADGRAEYARCQAAFAEEAKPLRDKLIACCEDILRRA